MPNFTFACFVFLLGALVTHILRLNNVEGYSVTELLPAHSVPVMQLDYGFFTTLGGSLKKMIRKIVILGVIGVQRETRKQDLRLKAGKTDLKDHLFDKTSWLHSFHVLLFMICQFL